MLGAAGRVARSGIGTPPAMPVQHRHRRHRGRSLGLARSGPVTPSHTRVQRANRGTAAGMRVLADVDQGPTGIRGLTTASRLVLTLRGSLYRESGVIDGVSA